MPLAKKPHFKSRAEAHQCGRKSAGVSFSASFSDSRKKGSMGVGIPYVLQCTNSSSSSSSAAQVDILSQYLDHWGALLSTGLCFIWLRITNFCL